MCGRTVCALAPDGLRSCCRYEINGTIYEPRWIDAPGPHHYSPSYNFCPTNTGPILASESHFDNKESSSRKSRSENDRKMAFHEMKWGLISSWQKSDESSFAYKMINARAESLTQKPTFKKLLNEGRRCVFVVDGFYEWKERKGASKQPYFIYMPETDERVWEREIIKSEESVKSDVSDKNRSFGQYDSRRLMFLAALFDVNTRIAEYPVYSFTVITVNAADPISTIHDRMPAILPDERSVLEWIDYENVSAIRALKILTPYSQTKFHPVSTSVNNVSFKEHKCVEPIVENKIDSFFKSKSSSVDSKDAPPMKKEKLV